MREQRERADREDALAAQYREQEEQRVTAVAAARAQQRAVAQADVDKVLHNVSKAYCLLFIVICRG